VNFAYLSQPPKRYTFEQPQLKQWVEMHCTGSVLNLFAGKIRLNVEEVRVDIDPTVSPDYTMDAFTFVTSWNVGKFDTVVLDPPYNVRKAREKYDGRYLGVYTKIKDALPRIMADKGRVISLGYDTVGMSRSRGFQKIAVCVVCHGGDHNDTLGLVERRVIKSLYEA